MEKLNISEYEFNVIERENLQGFDNFKTLFECYNKPSIIKQDIYKECIKKVNAIEDYFGGNSIEDYGVLSYNFNMFTFGANIVKNGELIAVYYETKTRREIWIKRGGEI